MKILRSTLAIILFFNFFVSCTADDLVEEQEPYTSGDIKMTATGDKEKKIKEEKE